MTKEEIKEKVIEILGDINPDIDYSAETSLIDGGLLDSFDIVSLVGELNDAFDIRPFETDLNGFLGDAVAAFELRGALGNTVKEIIG